MRLDSKIIRVILIAAVLLVSIVSAILIYGNSLFPKNSVHELNCSSLSKVKDASGFEKSNQSARNASFLIVEADSGAFKGMNGSYYHTFPPSAGFNSTFPNWPVIQVRQNQSVTITIINCASSEPHGFAIAHYNQNGVSLPEGQSYTFTFVASEAGKFRMYCNIECAIHPYMQNGLLIVS